MTTRNRPSRRIIPGLVLATALGIGAVPVAVADTPITEIPAHFAAYDAVGGSLLPNHDTLASITSVGGVAWAGHQGMLTYCSPYGSGTAIVGYQMLLGRWHASQGDGVIVNENSSNGQIASHTDGSLPKGRADVFGAWNGAQPAMTPAACIGVQIAVRTTTATALAWTTDLQRVAIQDLTGPWVANGSAQSGWVTGSTVAVAFDQSDNTMNRGAVRAEAIGGGAVDLGDPANGAISVQVPVEGLPDGPQQVRITRTGQGWSPSGITVPFMLDRMAPPVPGIQVTTEDWTNAPVTVTAPAGTDVGQGSGWEANEYSVDGGAWQRRAETWSFDAGGVHSVRARSVDHAGNRSEPSAGRQIKIDRIAPVIGGLEIDASSRTGAELRFTLADGGGSTLGSCAVRVDLMGPVGDWTTVHSVAGELLAPTARLVLPMTGRGGGEYQVRVTACDMAGTTVTRTGRFLWNPGSGAVTEVGSAPQRTVTAPDTTAPQAQAAARTPLVAGALSLVGRRPAVARFGGSARISGNLVRDGRTLGSRTVAIIDPLGRVVRTVQTDSAGWLDVTVAAQRSGRYVVRLADDDPAEATVPVTVRPRLAVIGRRGGRAGRVTVLVAPGSRGRVVRLQRRGTWGWSTISAARTDGMGVARLPIAPGAGRLRVQMPAQHGWPFVATTAPVM